MTRQILFEIVPGLKEATGVGTAPVEANPQISQIHILNLRVPLRGTGTGLASNHFEAYPFRNRAQFE